MLLLELVLSGKQRLDSLEIDDFHFWHVEHMLNQHGSVLIVAGKLSEDNLRGFRVLTNLVASISYIMSLILERNLSET